MTLKPILLPDELQRGLVGKVNRALAWAGYPVTLVKGKGYHYYVFDTVEAPPNRAWRAGLYETESVMTPYTSQQSVERWAEDGKRWAEQFRVASNILPG